MYRHLILALIFLPSIASAYTVPTLTVGFGNSIFLGAGSNVSPLTVISWLPDNEGVAGNTCDQISTRLDTYLASNNPDYVFIMCGTNDTGFEFDIDETMADIAGMIAAVVADGAIPVFVTPPPLITLNSRDLLLIEMFPLMRDAAADGGAQFVDGRTLIEFSADPSASLPDGIHPEQLGADFIGDEINKRVLFQQQGRFGPQR